MSMDENDNLELLSIKCPHCSEVTRVDQWVTMAVKTTSCSASFSFMGKPKDSNSLICPKCKSESNYLEILDAMAREQ
ncbi:hypothetical protein E4K67_22275 [Desulfosporosinus fructosivorans]|uniref:Uncharacterized protein n=1 Tax=Desulfosporosinus fructosivorans TaxID=2018669 RepID=A0A4Z0QZH4_9FIRM|nr:hypothetical protein [Desulfosporosinus fructosivorans]TGE35850.1 hypothetical protein E4K67_22275 [Desulfosporosinus fructosivorans]